MNKRVTVRILSTFVITLCIFAIMRITTSTPQGKHLVVYAYSDMLSHEVFEQFEEETGITVTVKYFEMVEELMTLFSFSKGSVCDVVIPGDAMIETLRKAGYLQKIDKSLLTNFSEVDQRLCSRYFDPENTYSVPCAWSPIGIGYDTRAVTAPADTIGWDIVFGQMNGTTVIPPAELYGAQIDHICMGEDPTETTLLAAIHLYGHPDSVAPEQLDHIVALLRTQKKWIESYTNNLKYFLLSGISPVVVIPAAYMIAIMAREPHVNFVIPQRGTLSFFSNLAIPTTCTHAGRAHKLIDFLLSEEGGLACFEEHKYNPANKNAYSKLPQWVQEHPYLSPYCTLFNKFFIEHNKIPLGVVEHMWHQIKL